MIAIAVWAITEMSQSMISYELMKDYIESKDTVKDWNSPTILEKMKESERFKKDEIWPTCGKVSIKNLKD